MSDKRPQDDWKDPVVEYYKQFVDVTLLEENLKLTPAERLDQLQRMMNDFVAFHGLAEASYVKEDDSP